MGRELIPNVFKKQLRERQQIGIWSTLCSNIVTEALGDSGFDWLLIDTEHSPNEVSDVLSLLQSLNGSEASPIVRPAWNDPVLIKRLLDIGAQTLLVPFIQTAEEAARAVAAMHYPGRGIRGVAGAHRANRYGRVTDYPWQAGSEVCVVLQIESKRAVSAIPQIAAVDGVDALFIGPSDLAADIGHIGNSRHPEVQQEISRAFDLCQSANMPVGILAPSRDQAEKWLNTGFSFVAVATDIGLLTRHSDALVEHFRELTKLSS